MSFATATLTTIVWPCGEERVVREMRSNPGEHDSIVHVW